VPAQFGVIPLGPVEGDGVAVAHDEIVEDDHAVSRRLQRHRHAAVPGLEHGVEGDQQVAAALVERESVAVHAGGPPRDVAEDPRAGTAVEADAR
jgi:hypothetical protein